MTHDDVRSADIGTGAGAGNLHGILTPSIDEAAVANDAFRAIVHDPVVRLIAELRSVAHGRERGIAPDAITVLLVTPSTGPMRVQAAYEGLFEAIRGIVGTLTLELAPSGIRINLVRAVSRKDAEDTLNFLGTADASFVAGSTLDLTARVT